MDQKFMHLTRHVKIYHRTYIQVEDPILYTVQLCVYSSTRTNIMYNSTIRLYTTEGNAKALESAERIGGTAALTDWVAKMVVVLELLTPLSIKQLFSTTWTSSDAIAEMIEVELYVEKYTNTPSAPSYCTRYFFKSMPPPNNFICSLKWLGKWIPS